MSRMMLTVLLLTAVGGCFALSPDPFEPDPGHPVHVVSTKSTVTFWPRDDGTVAQSSTSARSDVPAVVRPSSTTVPARRTGAAEASIGSEGMADAGLVRATYTQTKKSSGGGADASKLPLHSGAGKTGTDATESTTANALATTALAGEGPTRLRLVSSKRISFNYAVQDGSPSTAVAMWWTQDMKSWNKCDTVSQANGTCVVAVKDDGLYGFALRAAGEGPGDRPATGEVPQVWIAVDTTKPVVKMLGTEMDDSARTPTLILRWSAQDKNFGPRPMTLSYAERPDGPWMILAANVENTGRFEWALPGGVPPGVYLRIQATDLMGNVGLAQTTNKLLLPQTGVAELPPAERTLTARDAAPPGPPQPVLLPTIPSVELPRPAPAPRPQVSILSVEPDKN
jgi:hypothetical protein